MPTNVDVPGLPLSIPIEEDRGVSQIQLKKQHVPYFNRTVMLKGISDNCCNEIEQTTDRKETSAEITGIVALLLS